MEIECWIRLSKTRKNILLINAKWSSLWIIEIVKTKRWMKRNKHVCSHSEYTYICSLMPCSTMFTLQLQIARAHECQRGTGKERFIEYERWAESEIFNENLIYSKVFHAQCLVDMKSRQVSNFILTSSWVLTHILLSSASRNKSEHKTNLLSAFCQNLHEAGEFIATT